MIQRNVYRRITRRLILLAARLKELLYFFSKEGDEVDKVIYAGTKFVMFVSKNKEPFSICKKFAKMACDMSSDSQLAKKCGATKNKTTQIIKGKGNRFLVLKKLNLHSVRREENFSDVIHNFVFVSSTLLSCHQKATEVLRIRRTQLA